VVGLGQRFEDRHRLIVLLPGGPSREDVRISKGRFGEPRRWTWRGSCCKPSARQPAPPRHVIVTLHSEGALWMRRAESGEMEFRLIFDSGTWKTSGWAWLT